MKKTIFTRILLFVVLFTLPFSLSASSGSDYTYIFGDYGGWLASNNVDLKGNSDVYNTAQDFGQLEIRPTSWWPGPPVRDIEIRIVTPLVDPGNNLRLVNTADPTKYFDYALTIKTTETKNGVAQPTITRSITYPDSSFTTKVGIVGTSYESISKFHLQVTPNPNANNSYRGTYVSPLHFEVLDDEGAVAASKSYAIIMYYDVKSAPNQNPINYFFIVTQHPIASNIDVAYLSQNPSTLVKVGAVDFGTTETTPANYTLKISPGAGQGGSFKFIKPNSSDSISYKVVTSKNWSSAKTTSFSQSVTLKGITGFWQDFIEIGIREINYDNQPLKGGDCSSSILIEVLKQ